MSARRRSAQASKSGECLPCEDAQVADTVRFFPARTPSRGRSFEPTGQVMSNPNPVNLRGLLNPGPETLT